jgi:hypothetical protein
MPIELQLLVWAAILTLIQMLIAVAGAQSQVSLPVLAGNREGMAPLTGWALRAQRAHVNMLESRRRSALRSSSGGGSPMRSSIWPVCRGCEPWSGRYRLSAC